MSVRDLLNLLTGGGPVDWGRAFRLALLALAAAFPGLAAYLRDTPTRAEMHQCVHECVEGCKCPCGEAAARPDPDGPHMVNLAHPDDGWVIETGNHGNARAYSRDEWNRAWGIGHDGRHAAVTYHAEPAGATDQVEGPLDALAILADLRAAIKSAGDMGRKLDDISRHTQEAAFWLRVSGAALCCCAGVGVVLALRAMASGIGK